MSRNARGKRRIETRLQVASDVVLTGGGARRRRDAKERATERRDECVDGGRQATRQRGDEARGGADGRQAQRQLLAATLAPKLSRRSLVVVVVLLK